MLLKTLLAAVPAQAVIGPNDRVVESIAYDSRRVGKNSLFVALRGEKSDGHQFIEQAVERGATVIVSERRRELRAPRTSRSRTRGRLSLISPARSINTRRAG
jgi:UDP-N-acetylmuramyl pentapeptide synthase